MGLGQRHRARQLLLHGGQVAAPDVERAYVEQILPVKQRYYLDYVARHSVGGDVRILLNTLAALLGVGRGS